MAIDRLLFKENGAQSFEEDPRIRGIAFCSYCGAWHMRLKHETGKEFCAFCRTTHHSRACGAGLGEKCGDKTRDPIHDFLTKECREHQKFDLNFCKECNCFHTKKGWKMCLENNKVKPRWSKEKKLVWKMRWRACRSESLKSVKSERTLFDRQELSRILPYEYPFSNASFVHHCNV